MLPKAETACFAIADISGYTHFVSGVELDHAQDIIADIMDTLVRALRPPFRLAKFEGDAAFVYALADKVDGSLLQDSIEQAYFAFRKRLRSIKQANSCECQACSRMQSLDVKFVVHHGEFIRQKMSGREELAGRDVILSPPPSQERRRQDIRPARLCALFRRLRAGDGDRSTAQGLIEHAEVIEHIGETKCWVSDLEEAWTRETEAVRSLVQRAGAFLLMERDFAAPRQVLWDLVTSPQHHARWQQSDGVVENTAQGASRRRDAEPLPAWQERRHRGHRRLASVRLSDPDGAIADPGRSENPGLLRVRGNASDGGTHFEFRVAKPKPKDLPFYESVRPTTEANFTAGFDILRTMAAERAAASAARGRAAHAGLAATFCYAASARALARIARAFLEAAAASAPDRRCSSMLSQKQQSRPRHA